MVGSIAVNPEDIYVRFVGGDDGADERGAKIEGNWLRSIFNEKQTLLRIRRRSKRITSHAKAKQPW